MRQVTRWVAVAAFVAISNVRAPIVRAGETAADFYKSHSVTIFIGDAPGGGFDLYGRLLAQYMGRHLPGSPAVLAQNMPGGSGLRVMQYMEFTAPKDGTAIGLSNSNLISGVMLNPKRVDIDLRPVNWLGSFAGDTKVCFASTASGLRTIGDLQKKMMNLGGTIQGSTALYGALLKEIVGGRLNLIFGYQANADVWIAVDKGEIDGSCTGWSSIPAARPSWVSDHKINVLVQFVDAPSRSVPAAPLAVDLASSPELKSAIQFLTAPDRFTRPVMAPPGTPADKVQILRKAFDDTMADDAFLDNAKKLKMEIDPISGAQLAQAVGKILATPESTLATVRALLKD